MNLHSPQSAVLVGRDLQRPRDRRPHPARPAGRASSGPSNAQQILRRNIWIYGVGGIIVPFIFIKLIDLILTALGAY